MWVCLRQPHKECIMEFNTDWTQPLDQLYSAVGKPELWQAALDSLCETVGADSALIFTPCPQLLDMRHHWSSKYSADTIHDYLQNFLLEDPYNASASSRDLFRMGSVITGDELVPMSHLKTTRFYHEFLVKHNQGQLLVGLPFLLDNPHNLPTVVLSFYRSASQSAFSEHEVSVLNKLLPHIQRAWLLHDQAEKYKTLNTALEGALNQLSHGVLILNQQGAMRFANAAAKRFLSSVYLSELKNQKNNMIGLPTALLDVVSVAANKKMSCKKVMLNRSDEWFVVAAKLKHIPHFQNEGSGDDVVVWLTKNDQQRKTSADLIAELFNLTLSEGKVLERLFQNQTPQEIAEILDVKISTVRTHLASLLAKTNSKRQQDLIRLAAAFEFIDTAH